MRLLLLFMHLLLVIGRQQQYLRPSTQYSLVVLVANYRALNRLMESFLAGF